MKLLPVILLVAVFAHSKVVADSFECYKCSGNGCNDEGTATIVNCYDDAPIVPTTTTTTTTTAETTTTTYTATTGDTTTTAETTTITAEETTTAETTMTTDPTTTEETTAGRESIEKASEILPNNYGANSRNRRAADDKYACYTLSIKDGDTTKTQKGCAKKTDDENTCNSIATPAETSIEDCNICTEPRCNSSTTITLSILAIAAAFYLRYLM